MKTLGQIAYETANPDGRWECVDEHYKSTIWEAAAKAVATIVRAATIEECAKLCDTETAIPGRYFAADIRSLALE